MLVDDDPAIRRLVQMVLEDEPLSLVLCASVDEARQALRSGPVQLLLTDLMMPGESGQDLLLQLQPQAGPERAGCAAGAGTPALLPRPAHVVVFSAGLDAATQHSLARLGVWRLLSKPVAVAALLDTVQAALRASTPAQPAAKGAPQEVPQGATPVTAPAAAQAATPATAPATAPAAGPPSADDGPAPSPSLASPQQQAMDTHFGGDAALFHAYLQACLPLFADDLALGDAALARRDAAALRRLGHSLKSVLRSLGEAAAADAAQALDTAARDAAAAADGAEGRSALSMAWLAMRAHLDRLRAQGQGETSA